MAANKTVAANQIPGLARWMEAINAIYYDWDGLSIRDSRALLPEAYKFVQSASGLGRWMFEISRVIDTENSWNIRTVCPLADGQVQSSSPFGVWMREVSQKT